MSDDEPVFDVGPFRRLLELRDAHGEADKAAKFAKAELDEAQLEVFALLDASPITGQFTLDLGPPYGEVSFRKRATTYGRVLDKDAAIAGLRKLGLEDVLTRDASIRSQRLNEEVAERIEHGQPLPDGVDYYVNKGVTVTRKRKSAT